MSFPSLTGPGDIVGIRGQNAQIKTAVISAASSGTNTVVSGVAASAGAPAKIIRVLSYVIVCLTAVTVTWKTSGGASISGAMSFAATGGVAVPFNPLGHFDTVAGDDLVLNLGSAVQCSGHLTYVLAV